MLIEASRRVVSLLGGSPAVARGLRCGRGTVWRWTKRRDEGGTGGIPSSRYDELIDLAARRGITLTYEDFVRAPAESADA